eukprot:742646-Rhodomonas_salina.2
MTRGYPNPDGSGHYLYEGQLHEKGGQLFYTIPTVELQLLLKLASEAPPTIELQGTETEFGIYFRTFSHAMAGQLHGDSGTNA